MPSESCIVFERFARNSLGCHDIKTLTLLLVDIETTNTLVETADHLFDSERAPKSALAGR
ncbi:hypothetical protein [Novosphingobium sp. 9U]|uniref:hypothetical protein n=1 Tax=Novosphingobium sp. 9U TaxID=2653158 RepID=UPI0012F01125|nr:hypothetical protein [Novosphingobium sp. 9U]VWX50451.1 hypothetical protein NOVOSPHI9U_290007 [Novosphingobium sp. 9U]